MSSPDEPRRGDVAKLGEEHKPKVVDMEADLINLDSSPERILPHAAQPLKSEANKIDSSYLLYATADTMSGMSSAGEFRIYCREHERRYYVEVKLVSLCQNGKLCERVL